MNLVKLPKLNTLRYTTDKTNDDSRFLIKVKMTLYWPSSKKRRPKHTPIILHWQNVYCVTKIQETVIIKPLKLAIETVIINSHFNTYIVTVLPSPTSLKRLLCLYIFNVMTAASLRITMTAGGKITDAKNAHVDWHILTSCKFTEFVKQIKQQTST